MFTVDQQISLWIFRHGEKKYFENISAFNLVPRSQTCKILRLRETVRFGMALSDSTSVKQH